MKDHYHRVTNSVRRYIHTYKDTCNGKQKKTPKTTRYLFPELAANNMSQSVLKERVPN